MSYEERVMFYTLKKDGYKIREIARRMGRSHTTFIRELTRNKWDAFPGEYNFSCAQRKADARRRIARKTRVFSDPDVRNYVIEKLKTGWSPEQISARMGKAICKTVSHEAIYRHIYARERDLIEALPQKRKKRKKRGSQKQDRKLEIPNKTSIELRSKRIELRKEFGHWESDTMIGNTGKSCLNVSVERKAGLVKIQKIPDKKPENTRNAIMASLKLFPKRILKSLTYDNGTENMLHEEINRVLGMKSYFCHPYSSWEKGTVENTNGLIRRYFPKKTNFDLVSDKEIKNVENLLNNRPRKRLNFKTPLEYCVRYGALGM
jgi:IS30 family transposase